MTATPDAPAVSAAGAVAAAPVAAAPAADRAALEQLVAETDTGGRKPRNPKVAHLIALVALAWALFQLWFASPLPFRLGVLIFNDSEARAIHLALAVFLTFLTYPALKRSPRRYVPLQDWVLAAIGAFAAAYLFLFYRELAARPGQPTTVDIVVAVVGIVLLLECARRAVGPALTIIASIMIAYIFLGPYMPGLIAHKGATLGRAASQLWLTSEGVFGVAIGVSTTVIFLFVLFGNLLERAGAGNYMIQLAFSLLGRYRGGPAKAAVVASGMTGMISGSSVANVVTTGTFTIPLMKRVGYSPVKAGAIECAAGVNGQLMPPVMGAAAFLIAEYVGISYADVVKHAFLPAFITYAALFYIVDIEAAKAGMKGLLVTRTQRVLVRLMNTLFGFLVFAAIAAIVYYGIGWTKNAFGDQATIVLIALLAIAYVALVWVRARYPDLPADDPETALKHVPGFWETLRTGLHFTLPIVVLIWCLMVEEMSPGLSAFYGTVFLMILLVTQRPLTALFRGERRLNRHTAMGVHDLYEGLVAGARNMTSVGIATATAGIIVGTVSLTGIGLVMTEIVEFLAAGNVIAMLALTALICIILGMGMPTTASYVVVATLMAPVVVELAAQNDLAVPLVAVHMFVFYFGLMADVTPPVGLAAYAAAAISGADPVKTGFQGFRYEIRTGLLPFIFVFNTELLLIDIGTIGHFLVVLGSSLVAMALFVAATQGWFLTRNRWYEGIVLLLCCFTLFRPGFWMDMIYPPFVDADPKRIVEYAARVPEKSFLRFVVTDETASGKDIVKTVRLPMGAPGKGEERLKRAGLTVTMLGDKVTVANVVFRSQAAKLGIDPQAEIKAVKIDADRPDAYLMAIPALLLMLGVGALQRARRRGERMAMAPKMAATTT